MEESGAVRIGLVTLDNTGRIALFNKAAELMLGYRAQEVHGKPCEEVFTGLTDVLGDSGGKHPDNWPEMRLKTEARREDGRTIPLMVTVYAMPADDPSAARSEAILAFQDAREAEGMENQPGSCPCGRFKHLHRLLSLDHFAAGIVHEIRNPLTGISTNAQHMLERISPSEPFHEEMQDILADVKDIEGIVSKVLDFAHPSKSQIREAPVEDIVTEVLRFSRLPLRRQNVRLHVDLKKPSARVKVDVSQVKQVFFNIIRNACDAMPEGGELRVSTTYRRAGDRHVRVDVTDTGRGVTADHLKRIFDPFFSTHREGTGLGLAISRKIIEEHGGSIEVKSEPGKGATFGIVLPTT
jgi:PAS domain S-box-containing protein